MMKLLKAIFVLALYFHSSSQIYGQNSLRANGEVINNERCVEIKQTTEDLAIAKEVLSDIMDASIVDNCIELKIQYNGCDGNIEFVTDGKIISSPKPKMNFRLNWIEPSKCKEIKEVLVTFDLSPYKKLIQENKAVISILGTEIKLKYKN